MSDHLRFAGLPDEIQRRVFLDLALSEPLIADALALAARLDLPDWMIVSGALYNTIWNQLTGRPSGHGIKDIDLFYHDATDLSWEAEDRVIKQGADIFRRLAAPVEIRNQARVHLWYRERFGESCPVYESSGQSLRFFASKTHAVGLRYNRAGNPEVLAPFGLDDIFSFRITPNHALDNRVTHMTKGERARRNWPEVSVVPW